VRTNRLQALVRKHCFKKKSKLDIYWLTSVLNLEEKLMIMFFDIDGYTNGPDSTLGNKYASNGVNIWANDHQQPPYDKLNISLDEKREAIQKLSSIFHEDS
jgi:hypothetical protein